ncbi:hypothetical protein PCC7424_4301 [Gloeothece citriformis PCC 7424]|uniref:Uncharacterized protein n=1 Tax=Gloeothece citriformis (strain PCC 7424) TaxID=65393 RepID=B7K6W9_GLOC7|nr:hypothetical protein [Gloeothece citriformis]ACK72668.1 hypothetical protein PCC7424_4301 [Gloeothece citriformis PCC 7424]
MKLINLQKVSSSSVVSSLTRPRTTQKSTPEKQEQSNPTNEDQLQAQIEKAASSSHNLANIAIFADNSYSPPQTDINPPKNPILKSFQPLTTPQNLIQRGNGSDETNDWSNQEISQAVKITVKLTPPGNYEEEVTINNYDDLAEAYDNLSSAMFFDDNELVPDTDNNPHWKRWQNYRDTVETFAHWYLKQNKTQKPLNAEIQEFKDLMGQVRTVGENCYQAFQKKDQQYKKELAKNRQKVLEAQTKAKQALRLQFLGGDSNSDGSTAFLWSMTDHLFTFAGALSSAAENPYYLAAGKIIPGAVTVANVIVNWSSSNPAMFGTSLEGLAALNNVISLGGALNSFVINPGYIVTAYIGPMVNTISQMLGKLQMQLIETNDQASEILGSPLYIGAEPGGSKMWNYMVRAMQASSSAHISPPSGDVYDYFDKFRERFDTFNQQKYQGEMKSYKANNYQGEKPLSPDEIPTESSWIIFSEVNPKQFPRWLYYNRDMVWTVLYGSRDPSKAKLIEK